MIDDLNSPLVTVICTCYNQGSFVKEALESIVQQDYPNIEIIAIDDCSTDHSSNEIEDWIQHNPKNTYIRNAVNVGYTKTFNKALKLAKGSYIVDLAGDDILLDHFVSEHIKNFKTTKFPNIGVSFCNIELIEEDGSHMRYHHAINKSGNTINVPKEGDVYMHVLRDFYINPMSLMVKKEVYNALMGYDEALAFEDVDFWIRSSRIFDYVFVDKVLAKKRIHKGAMTTRLFGTIFTLKNGQREFERNYIQICQKVFCLNKNRLEDLALIRRIFFYYWKVIKSVNIVVFFKFLGLHIRTLKRIYISGYGN